MKPKSLTAQQQRARIEQLAVMKDVRINKQINTSIPATLKKIRHKKQRSEDCPSTVKNRVVVSHVVFYPQKHWLQMCGKCKMFLCRRTNKYNLDWQTAHSQTLVDIGHFRKSKPHSNQELSPDQQRNLQLYRNQLQSVRAQAQMAHKKIHKSEDSTDSE